MSGFKKRNYRKRVSRKGKRSSAVSRRKSSVTVGVKKYVNNMVNRHIENKCVQIQFSLAFGNVLEDPSLGAFPMCPLSSYWTINQGVGQGARVGNVIKPVKVHLNYVLRPMSYDVATNPNCVPTDIQLFLGYVKNTPSFIPIPGDFSYLFQNGSSSSGPVGNLRDQIAVINKDYWVIKKRWNHKIGFSQNNGTGAVIASQYFNNNDYKMSVTKRLDITKYIPKTIHFNDAVATTNNRNLFFFFQAVGANGGTFPATVLSSHIDYWIDFEYQDA